MDWNFNGGYGGHVLKYKIRLKCLIKSWSNLTHCTLHRARYVLGVGTSMADMEDMYSNTRYVSNVSSNLGGTGLTALYTGLGMYWGLELQWQI